MQPWKRKILEDEGVKLIGLRIWLIKRLLWASIWVEPVATLDLCNHLATGYYDDYLMDRRQARGS
jgi:hypothetical protein